MSTGRHKQERGVGLQPLDEINGYQVRPGFYNRDGATATTRGVSFTIHSFGATACYLLLFRPQEKEPYVTPKISGGLSYWKHIFHVRFWIENRRV